MIVREAKRLDSVFRLVVSHVAKNPAKIKKIFDRNTREGILTRIFDKYEYKSENGQSEKHNSNKENDIKITKQPSFNELHQGPTGDFLLMSKENWMDIRGCSTDNTNFGMDNQTITKAAAHNLTQIALVGSVRIYHVDHGKQEREGRPAKEWEKRKENMKSILKTKIINLEIQEDGIYQTRISIK
jgi:hypothetical protein